MYFDKKDIEEILLEYYGTLNQEGEKLLSQIVAILSSGKNPADCLVKLENMCVIDTCMDWYEWNHSIYAVCDMVKKWYVAPTFVNRIDFIASVRHLAWCCFRMAISENYNFVETKEQHSSLVDGVVFVLNNPDATAEDNHNNWVKYKKSLGWKWGESYSLENRTHPSIIEFSELPLSEQKKDIMDLQMTKAASDLYDKLLVNMNCYFSDFQNLLSYGLEVSFSGWEDGVILRYSDCKNEFLKINKKTKEYEVWDFKELMLSGWYISKK